MAEIDDEETTTCGNPGCDRPGTNQCSGCFSFVYCGRSCQVEDWPNHKQVCPGHLRKVGITYLEKARKFEHERNWEQTLRYGILSANTLKQLKDRRRETVKMIDHAFICQFNALQFMVRHTEALEVAEERYTLWATNHIRNPGSLASALALIQSCIHNKKYEDAESYSRHAMFMINDRTDNLIPEDVRPPFVADGSYLLALSILRLTMNGGIPPEEKQKAGEEAITLARQALEMHTQLGGTETVAVAGDMGALADGLEYFNNVDDDEILRLMQQAIAIYSRLEGNLSINVALRLNSLGNTFVNRANRAEAIHDMDQCIVNLQLALLQYREAAHAYRAINHIDNADDILRTIILIEANIQQIETARVSVSMG